MPADAVRPARTASNSRITDSTIEAPAVGVDSLCGRSPQVGPLAR